MNDPLAAAGVLEPLIRAAVDDAEVARRFPRPVIAAMAEARIFRLFVPRLAGGDEIDPITMLEVVESISRFDGETQRFTTNGAPATRIMLVPFDQVRILDTWSATGLRATGSHDVIVSDVFVPEEHSLWWTDGPTQPGPLYPVRFLIVTHAA